MVHDRFMQHFQNSIQLFFGETLCRVGNGCRVAFRQGKQGTAYCGGGFESHQCLFTCQESEVNALPRKTRDKGSNPKPTDFSGLLKELNSNKDSRNTRRQYRSPRSNFDKSKY